MCFGLHLQHKPAIGGATFQPCWPSQQTGKTFRRELTIVAKLTQAVVNRSADMIVLLCSEQAVVETASGGKQGLEAPPMSTVLDSRSCWTPH
jgi:hypothetical protein